MALKPKGFLTSKKHVFWQALFLTSLFFLLGLVLGVYFEQLRADNVNVEFYNSEVSLYDSFALGQILQDSSVPCPILKNDIAKFADRVYSEARQLEKYDESTDLTESVKTIHRKYDLLRTLLWINTINLKDKNPNCDLNTVVYLYTYDTQDVDLKARQLALSRVLGDLKNAEGDNIILIPIAVDQKIDSLDYLIWKYNVDEFPAVIVNEENVIYGQTTVSEIERYLG